LAYPKAVPDLLKYGKSEVAIYAITIAVIVASNLLEGVLVGLGLSILKLLYAFSQLDVVWDEDLVNQRTRLYLKGAATLIRLPQLAEQLEKIRPGSAVQIHVEDLNYIDHACLELINTWEKQHIATGGSLKIEWEALSNKYRERHTGD
jgi:MFS superfamily sulfate permease-like transporter